MRGRSSGKTAPPVPGLTRVGGGAINLPYIDILEDILTHISEQLLHITLDRCYISHWTVATYHTGLWFAIWYHIATYCNISGLSGNIRPILDNFFISTCVKIPCKKSTISAYICLISCIFEHIGTYRHRSYMPCLSAHICAY